MGKDKRLNEVIRVQKRRSNFVMMDKGFLENPNLSWKAKGILAYLLSKPDSWKVIVSNIINQSTDGKTAVYNGLKELSQHGHYVKRPIRNEQGNRIVQWESIVFEIAEDSKNLDNIDFSLLPDFQEVNNQKVGNKDIENQPLVKNDFSNNYCTNNQSSQSAPKTDGQDRTDTTDDDIEAYMILIKKNIAYSDLAVSRPYDIRLIDEFVAIILDAVMTENKTIRIGGEDKPRTLVKSMLLKLSFEDIEHALDQFKSITDRINNKKQYILTMLYNNKMELNSHYTNLVQHDMCQ